MKNNYSDLVFILMFLAVSGLLIYLTIPNANSAETKIIIPKITLPTNSSRPYRIVLVDTGVNNQDKYPICNDGHMSFFGNGTQDEIGHGTQMIEIIDSQAKKSGKNYCFVIVKAIGLTDGRIDGNRFVDAVKYVSGLQDIDIVNMSIEGTVYISEEVKYIKSMLDRKVVVIVAAGNRRANLDTKCNSYPACDDDRIIVVGQKDGPGSNYGKKVDVVVNGRYRLSNGEVTDGTSPSTAFVTGTILRLIK